MRTEIGFILKGYPRLSETFIAQEIFLLEQRGFRLRIYSMRAARDEKRHPVHAQIKAPVTYLPEDVFPSLIVPWRNLKVLLRSPGRYLGALGHACLASLRRWKVSPLKRLQQAAWLIEEEGLGRDGSPVGHLHSHFAHTPTELAFYLSRLTGITYSISAHAKDIYTSSPEEIRERVKASRFLMTCTHFNHDTIRGLVGGSDADKVHEVYHGVDLARFRGDGAPAGLPRARLITVARLVDKKGYDDVLEAMRLLRAKGVDVEYDIYGSGELEKAVRGWIKEKGLETAVRLHGSVDQDQVLAAYRDGGIFILGSRETADGDRDGIPNSMAEAMSMEMPVVATKVSGIPELVEDGVTGLLAAPRDPAGLAAAIERLLREPGLAAALGKAAREKVTKVFDRDRCIDKCVELLAPYGGPAAGGNVLFYCQHLLGIGHVTRSHSLVRELSKAFPVTYVQGGPPVALPLPEGAALVQLPPLLMREEDSSLYDPENRRSVQEIFAARASILRQLAGNRFTAVVIELYPFGRNKFSAEILELIREVKKHNPAVKVICSVRDILVEKPDAEHRSKKIVKILKENFDRVWVHADSNLVQLKDTFPLADQVGDLLFHTGFVADSRPLPPAPARKPKVLLSLGGGSVGAELYLAAARMVEKFPNHEFEFILGPYTENSLRETLREQLKAFADRVTFSPLRPDFEAALQESSLSISMGGYNTVMNLLRTRTPALVFPYDANQEQEMRAKILEKRGFLRILGEEDLRDPLRLEEKMRAALAAEFPGHVPDLAGASRSAGDLVRLIKG